MDNDSKNNNMNHVDSSSVKRNLNFTYESTPCGTRPRKRKSSSLIPATVTSNNDGIEHQLFLPVVSRINLENYSKELINESNSADNSFLNNAKFSHSNCSFNELFLNDNNFLRSSPYINNCTLSSSLKKCSLDDIDSESHKIKKRRWDDDEQNCTKKSSSAPNTPQRSDNESDNHLRKYHSLEFTPTKIGTIERNEILYPELIEVKPALKPKSPQKLRKELKRISKPPRKRLFPCKDFVYLFTNKSKLDNIVSQIFSYLNDADLVSVTQVSKLWKNALENDKDAYKRYKLYVKNVSISKENLYDDRVIKIEPTTGSFNIIRKSKLEVPVLQSPPTSPARENWRKFARVATQINSTQRLTKCFICSYPAVIEKSFAECTKGSCRYVWCIRCMSGSKTGPEDLTCLCSRSPSPPSPTNSDRSGLTDVSNIDNSSASYYFTEDHVMHNSSSNISSGYFSGNNTSMFDKSSSMNANHLSETNSKLKNTVLTNYNKNVSVIEKKHNQDKNTSETLHKRNNSTLKNVRQSVLKRRDINEPSSPQKTKLYPLGSKQTKKTLRRLCL